MTRYAWLDVEELISNARRNELALKRLQQFELTLLSCQTWFDLLDLIVHGLPHQFDLDGIALSLADPDGELKHAMMQSLDLDQGRVLNQVEFANHVPLIRTNIAKSPSPWASCLAMPLVHNEYVIGQLLLLSKNDQRFTAGMATDFMQHLAAVISACFFMVKQSEERSRLSLTDPLTGAENRRGFERSYTREWAQGLRHQQTFTLLMLDLDHFKQVNDQHGHATGDRVLKTLAKTLKATLRPTDHVGRLGGEEFAILLAGDSSAYLDKVVSRLQQSIRDMHVLNDQGEALPITASGSYAVVNPNVNHTLSLDDALAKLDAKLYDAKAQGRDQFLLACMQ